LHAFTSTGQFQQKRILLVFVTISFFSVFIKNNGYKSASFRFFLHFATILTTFFTLVHGY